ncbi:hypothetical protein [Methanopyrus sp.]
MRLEVPEEVLSALDPDSDECCGRSGVVIEIIAEGFGAAKYAIEDILRCVKVSIGTLETVRGSESATADEEKQGRAPRGPRSGSNDSLR